MDTRKQKQVNKLMKRRAYITAVAAVIAFAISGFVFLLMNMRVSHMHVIFMFVLGVSFLILTYMVLWVLGASEKYSRLVKILKRCYIVCLLIGIACFITLQVFIISGSRTDDVEVDAVIVLGAGLINNNPSLILSSRLNAAIEYIQTREDIPIIVTGGLGQGQTITEAEAMARYLVARGVDESRILKEDASTNSHENINFARNVMIDHGMDVENARVAVATNEFHLFRAKIIADKAGFEAYGIAAETPGLHRKLIYYFREAFSLVNELVFR